MSLSWDWPAGQPKRMFHIAVILVCAKLSVGQPGIGLLLTLLQPRGTENDVCDGSF